MEPFKSGHRYFVRTLSGSDTIDAEGMLCEAGTLIFMQGVDVIAAYAPGSWTSAKEAEGTRTPEFWQTFRAALSASN